VEIPGVVMVLYNGRSVNQWVGCPINGAAAVGAARHPDTESHLNVLSRRNMSNSQGGQRLRDGKTKKMQRERERL